MKITRRGVALCFSASCALWACGQTSLSPGDLAEATGGKASGGAESPATGGKPAQSSGGAAGEASDGGSSPSSGSAPSTGSVQGNETGGTSGSGGSPAVVDAIWYYLETEDRGVVVNVLAPDELIEIPGGIDVDTAKTAWSSSGKEAAFLVGESLLFYQLGAGAELVSTLPSAGYWLVHGYLSGVGAVVTGAVDGLGFVAVVRPDGEEIRLHERDGSQASLSVGVPPVDSTVVWTENGAEFRLSYATFEGPALARSDVLATYSSSPPLSQAWSPDGRWYSFGISGNPETTEGGMYLWRVGAEAPVRVSPDGANYAPFFPFAPDSSQLALWLSAGEATTLSVLGLSGEEPSAPVPLRAGANLSPAVWTPFGSLLYEDELEGYLQQVEAGSAATAHPFPGFAYSCEVFWLSEKRFFHDGCGESPVLVVGTVSDSGITEEEIAFDAKENFGLSPDRACYVQWDAQSILLGPTTGDLDAMEDLAPELSGISHVAFTPDSASLIWAQSDGIYRVALEDCAPNGEPGLVYELDGALKRAQLITPAR